MREVNVTTRFKYVVGTSQWFRSPYDGFIGISPGISASTGMIGNSDFINDLILKKMIDHPVVSFYTRNEEGNSSTIKFGGWDESGLEGGASDLKMYSLGHGEYETGDLGLPTRNISQGDLFYQHEPHKVSFNPSVPYIFVNAKDFQRMTTSFKGRW